MESHSSVTVRTYLKVAKVKANGHGNVTEHYEIAYMSPAKGINYYRIKQVDWRDSYIYSNTIGFAMNDKTDPVVFLINSSTLQVLFSNNANHIVQGLGMNEIINKDRSGSFWYLPGK